MKAIGIKTYLNYQIEDLDGEEWVDILGYDGLYLISNMGRVKSCQREVSMCGRGNRIKPEKIMKQQVSKSNYKNIKEPSMRLKVSFCVDYSKKTYDVSVLVGLAFVGTPKKGEVFSKKDKIWYNNKADNLQISTVSDCFKLAYKTGNNLRKKNHLTSKQKNLFIYTRLSDNKEFTGTELIAEYKSQVRSNIKKAIANNRMAYGSKWVRRPV